MGVCSRKIFLKKFAGKKFRRRPPPNKKKGGVCGSMRSTKICGVLKKNNNCG